MLFLNPKKQRIWSLEEINYLVRSSTFSPKFRKPKKDFLFYAAFFPKTFLRNCLDLEHCIFAKIVDLNLAKVIV